MPQTTFGSPGYMSGSFGQSYRPFGEVLRLPRTGLQCLRRQITARAYDLIGVYPYAMCADWSDLNRDVDDLRGTGAVSLVFVADPFQTEVVQKICVNWELCQHFKSHHVVDLTQDWQQAMRKNDRRIIRRALEMHAPRIVRDPTELAPQLWELYQSTINRKSVTGMQALSCATIEQQLAVEGAVLVAIDDEAGLVGAMLDYDHGGTAVCHLSFISERGQRSKASFALIYAGLVELRRRGCRFANLGGPAGNDDDLADGLARFKSKWTKETKSALICGTVLDPVAYRQLENEAMCQSAAFFPSYRAPGSPFN